MNDPITRFGELVAREGDDANAMDREQASQRLHSLAGEAEDLSSGSPSRAPRWRRIAGAGAFTGLVGVAGALAVIVVRQTTGPSPVGPGPVTAVGPVLSHPSGSWEDAPVATVVPEAVDRVAREMERVSVNFDRRLRGAIRGPLVISTPEGPVELWRQGWGSPGGGTAVMVTVRRGDDAFISPNCALPFDERLVSSCGGRLGRVAPEVARIQMVFSSGVTREVGFGYGYYVANLPRDAEGIVTFDAQGKQLGWFSRMGRWRTTPWTPRPDDPPLAARFAVLRGPTVSLGGIKVTERPVHRSFDSPTARLGIGASDDPGDICLSGELNIVRDSGGTTSFELTGGCFHLSDAVAGRVNYRAHGVGRFDVGLDSEWIVGIAPDGFVEARVGTQSVEIQSNGYMVRSGLAETTVTLVHQDGHTIRAAIGAGPFGP